MLAYPKYIFYHALSLFATLSGPPCHYRYTYSGKRRPDAEGRCWVPFRGSCKRGRVREGEGGYGLSGRPFREHTPLGTILANISKFKNSAKKQCQK